MSFNEDHFEREREREREKEIERERNGFYDKNKDKMVFHHT